MMDFDGALSAFLYREKRRTRKSRVWLKNLRCTGNESSLFECSHEGLGSHNCEGERKAGVLCRSKGLKGTRQLKMLNRIYFYLLKYKCSVRNLQENCFTHIRLWLYSLGRMQNALRLERF